MIKSVDQYILKHQHWQVEIEPLRRILLNSELEETMEWNSPVYTVMDKNLIGIAAFKSYFGLWFFQGALLKDREKVLWNAQESKTKVLRQWRFNSIADIDEQLVTQYITESIGNQKQGKTIKPAKPNMNFILPIKLANIMNFDEPLQIAFSELAPFKQKEFAEYITDAKRDTTILTRLEKIKPMIMAGVGLNDKYR